jgi:iron complex outermembrane recepter protein
MDRIQTSLSVVKAYRFLAVIGLFQATTVCINVINGNPNLKPEEALSSELSGKYFLEQGKLRLSLLQEREINATVTPKVALATGGHGSLMPNIKSPSKLRRLRVLIM